LKERDRGKNQKYRGEASRQDLKKPRKGEPVRGKKKGCIVVKNLVRGEPSEGELASSLIKGQREGDGKNAVTGIPGVRAGRGI